MLRKLIYLTAYILLTIALWFTWDTLKTNYHDRHVRGIAVLHKTAADVPFDPVTLINLHNTERAAAQVNYLALDPRLNASAHAKCLDMQAYGYWDHYNPTIKSHTPWLWMTDQGVSYRYAGENLAKNTGTMEHTVDLWLHSPEHKENMDNPHYSIAGFATCKGQLGTITVAHFVGY